MKLEKVVALSSLIVLLVGCSTANWLPSKTIETQTRWGSYQEVESVVKGIKRGHTLEDVKQLGLDVDKTPNVQSLTYLDIAKRFGLIGLRDHIVTVPAGVRSSWRQLKKGEDMS